MARKSVIAGVNGDQDLTIQKAALERDGCHVIFEEKVSGRNDGREKLSLASKYSRLAIAWS